MAVSSVTHTVTLSVGNIALALSDSQNSAADPTNFVVGDQTVDASTPEYLGRSDHTDALGDVEMSGHNVMLLLRNDNTTGGNLQVSLVGTSPVYELSIKPQQINLMSVTDVRDVKVLSSTGNVNFTFMVIQIDN